MNSSNSLNNNHNLYYNNKHINNQNINKNYFYPQQIGGNNDYKLKYLYYKNKYLYLKNKNKNNKN